MEIDLDLLKSTKGLLKIAEAVFVFVALLCYGVASRPPYIAATCMEFFITFGFLLLYLLKLNKRFTFIFWALIDVFNSFFAAAFMFILSLIAVSTYRLKGTLGGGIVGLVAVALLCLDGYLLLKKITFNKPGKKTTDHVEGN